MNQSSESPAVVSANAVRKSFGSTHVLQGVDLQIPEGAVVGLVGTNGAGKSTLIKCLLGLLKVSSGTATIHGEDAWNLSAEVKEKLCYVPQEIRIYPWMRVDQVIDYTAAFYQSWDTQWVESLVERWEVSKQARVNTLSAGQMQKLALVLGLGHRPELMILDEPVSSLDPVGRREFMRSLLELTGSDSRTVLFSTHITSDLERVASHVAILQDGRISYFDEIDTLKEDFKRIRIRAANELPSSFAVAGALRTEVSGNSAMVALPSVSAELINELEKTWEADVSVEDLNLEEIFVELHDA